MKAIFSERAFAAVLAETTEMITTETGGLFLGLVQEDVWYIIEAIDPGPKSVFEVAYFEYDQKYTKHLINKIANLYDRKLDLIGLWHRHPGSFDQFSSTDDGTNAKYASMREEGAISGLVNIDPTFRFTMYHVDQPCSYRRIAYEVGDDLIPAEFRAYKTPDRFFSLMEKRAKALSRRGGREGRKQTARLDAFMRSVLPYLAQAECAIDETDIASSGEAVPDKLAEAVIEDLTFLSGPAGVQVSVEMQEQYLVISQEDAGRAIRLYFMDCESRNSILLSYDGKCYLYHSRMLADAAEQAEAEAGDQASPEEAGQKAKRPGGVFGSVLKIIKFNKSEDGGNGN